MTKTNIYVVMGYSGAGKDTIGDWLAFSENAALVKFAAPGKRALEFMLKVEPGLLDDRVKRLEIAPHCQGRSYLQVLIDFWKHRSLLVGDELFTAQTKQNISNLLKLGQTVVVTDVRNLDEGKAIKELVHSGLATLTLIWVHRTSAKELESDVHQLEICDSLDKIATNSYLLRNSGTKQYLYKQLGYL